MQVKIDRGGCISCGLCENTCPEVFRLGDDGPAEVHHQPDSVEQEIGAQEAAQACPVSVIACEE